MSRERQDDIAKKIKRETDATEQKMGRRPLMLSHAAGTLNTVTPCAACKLLRRRCAQECPFSPYFSPHEPQKFASVHKVFGASNVAKMLMEVPENQRADAANSLVYEANVRLRDPVYGCMGAITALQHQAQSLQAELNALRAEILKYKFRESAASILNQSHANPLPNSTAAAPIVGFAATASPPVPPQAHPQHPANKSSSMYTQSSSVDFSSTSNENASYFG